MQALTPVDDPEVQQDVEYTLLHLWGLPTTTYGKKPAPFRVPCTSPCSILREQLPLLHQTPYKVGEKSDGVRFYLVASFFYPASSPVDQGEERNYAVLVNRAGHMLTISIQAPNDLFAGTLLDGELCELVDGTLSYVVFDAVACNGYSVKEQPHSVRLTTAQSVLSTMTVERITLSLKTWHPLSDAVSLWATCQATCDGLILVPEKSPLRHGTQRDLFKWKPGDKHTLDLFFNGKYLCAIDDRGELMVVTSLYDCVLLTPLPLATVCELALTAHPDGNGRYQATLVKQRDDKLTPNHFRVVDLTLQNIVENVSVQELVQ